MGNLISSSDYVIGDEFDTNDDIPLIVDGRYGSHAPSYSVPGAAPMMTLNMATVQLPIEVSDKPLFFRHQREFFWLFDKKDEFRIKFYLNACIVNDTETKEDNNYVYEKVGSLTIQSEAIIRAEKGENRLPIPEKYWGSYIDNINNNKKSTSMSGEMQDFGIWVCVDFGVNFEFQLLLYLKEHAEKKWLIYGDRVHKMAQIFGKEVDDECVICLSGERNVVVLPCSHVCLCSDCASVVRNQMGTCPLCRTHVNGFCTLQLD